MSEVYNDLISYKNLFEHSSLSAKEEAQTINWSERKCYVYKYFISTLCKVEISLLKEATSAIDYNIVGAICLYQTEKRVKIFEQLSRIEESNSPFEEIQAISNEGENPNPLHSMSSNYWRAVKKYLIDLEIDSYPFNKKAINFLNSVAFTKYQNLSAPQLKWINSLIEADRTRPETDHYFVNEYLLSQGFTKECKAILGVWRNC